MKCPTCGTGQSARHASLLDFCNRVKRHFTTRSLDTIALSLHTAPSAAPPPGYSISPQNQTRIAQRNPHNTHHKAATFRDIPRLHNTRPRETASQSPFLNIHCSAQNSPPNSDPSANARHRTATIRNIPRAVQDLPPR